MKVSFQKVFIPTINIQLNQHRISEFQLNAAPVPEPEDTLSPLIGVNKYKQKKIKSKRSFRSKEAYQNQNRPFSDGTLDDEPPTVPPKQVILYEY